MTQSPRPVEQDTSQEGNCRDGGVRWAITRQATSGPAPYALDGDHPNCLVSPQCIPWQGTIFAPPQLARCTFLVGIGSVAARPGDTATDFGIAATVKPSPGASQRASSGECPMPSGPTSVEFDAATGRPPQIEMFAAAAHSISRCGH